MKWWEKETAKQKAWAEKQAVAEKKLRDQRAVDDYLPPKPPAQIGTGGRTLRSLQEDKPEQEPSDFIPSSDRTGNAGVHAVMPGSFQRVRDSQADSLQSQVKREAEARRLELERKTEEARRREAELEQKRLLKKQQDEAALKAWNEAKAKQEAQRREQEIAEATQLEKKLNVEEILRMCEPLTVTEVRKAAEIATQLGDGSSPALWQIAISQVKKLPYVERSDVVSAKELALREATGYSPAVEAAERQGLPLPS